MVLSNERDRTAPLQTSIRLPSTDPNTIYMCFYLYILPKNRETEKGKQEISRAKCRSLCTIKHAVIKTTKFHPQYRKKCC